MKGWFGWLLVAMVIVLLLDVGGGWVYPAAMTDGERLILTILLIFWLDHNTEPRT